MADERGNGSQHPRIDLVTVRETLAYMHDDMRAAPALEKVRQALADALQEIDALDGHRSRNVALVSRSNVRPFSAMRLVSWRPQG